MLLRDTTTGRTHVISDQSINMPTSMTSLKHDGEGSSQTHEQAVNESSPSRVVQKPVPEAQLRDPRGYQIGQLRRRFSPRETKAHDGALSLIFNLAPTDPDFPFELDHLECDLRIPEDYPEERPALRVRNKDIPRGFGINIERGWEVLAEENKASTLLALVNALDKNLESILSEEKADTVKLVAFQDAKDTRHLAVQPPAPPVVKEPAQHIPPPISKPYIPEESYTKEQIAKAKAQRAQEVRQLEARMGRMPTYRRSADGIVYTLPIEPKRRNELPAGIKYVNSLHLIVPLLYPLQDLRVQLNEVDSEEAEPVEELFVEKAAAQKQMTLMSHMNYLAQNLHTLVKQVKAEADAAAAAKAEATKSPPLEQLPEEADGHVAQPAEKSHIQVIPRPPEWSFIDDGEGSSDGFDSDEGGVNLGEEEEAEEPAPAASADTPEKGTMLSFPSIELHGIEILQVSILSITVKCDRCKTANDITGLRPNTEKSLACKKCNSPLAAKFRPVLVHEHSSRAGFIDLSGCKVADMLPSTFTPTCSKCSTQGIDLVSVRGETMTNICRECHGKFTFKIPDVKFLFITPGSLPPPNLAPRRKQERLGLHAGDPLPKNGACAHYRKSYRWFRFSCCNKVYACDKCHDENEDHIQEWANRMICGWCSREQNYTVEACGFCGRSVIGRKGRGFWEGGKGTRDQKLMNRKDPRKYKRIGGGTASKKD